MKLIDRQKDFKQIRNFINDFPVTAIIGARQCGKTTLAKQLPLDHYFDLENPRDLARFEQPLLTLENLRGLIGIDEIQRKPDLFPLLRHLTDRKKKQKFLILGSASGELMQQSSESLAGRIAYYSLGGFALDDIGMQNSTKLWIRGGLPRAFLASSDQKSAQWREQYISTFLERDIPQLGIAIPPYTLRRFWLMLSHYHAQIINYAELGRSFGISDMTVRKYVDILSSTFMIRILPPWYVNIGKRLVKRPKIYLRDSGIFHSLLSVDIREELNSHPKLGASWEGFALEMVSRKIGKSVGNLFFWKSHAGAELDLFWQDRGKNWGVEFKYADAPKLTKSMQISINDLELEHLWVVYPGLESYPLSDKITVSPVSMDSY
ncbi:MAG: ATP-binding protein, partial [Candidatus Marinimicrobia bacterium]|nr:ATP-binding protein [Candidatus Neomarinimicrobiota bacterium]